MPEFDPKESFHTTQGNNIQVRVQSCLFPIAGYLVHECFEELLFIDVVLVMTLAYLNPRTTFTRPSNLCASHFTRSVHASRIFFYVSYASPTQLTVVSSITFVAVVIRYFFCSDTTKTI